MQLYQGILVSATDRSADVVFADATSDFLILRLRGGSREETIGTPGNRHPVARSTVSRPDYVVTDDHGTAIRARESIDYSATLPGTVDVVIPSPGPLNLAGVLSLSARSEPITIEFSLRPVAE